MRWACGGAGLAAGAKNGFRAEKIQLLQGESTARPRTFWADSRGSGCGKPNRIGLRIQTGLSFGSLNQRHGEDECGR